MKKYLLLFFTFFVLSSQAQMVIDGQPYTVDTLKNHLAGPGTRYTAIRLTGPHKQNVFFLKTDLKNPYIEVKQVLGRDSIYGGEIPSSISKRKSTAGAAYFAGTNGDFYDTGTTYGGYPTGGNMGDSEMAKTPITWNVFAIDENKIPGIGYMTYSGNVKFGESTWTITSFNHTRETNALVLYNRHNGKYTHTNSYGTEVLIELLQGSTWGVNKTLYAKVLEIEKNKGNMAIPAGKAVLSGHGTSAADLELLNVGDEIEIDIELIMDETNNATWAQMTGGDNYKTMLKNGVVETVSVWDERHPRTAIGYSITGDTLIFCVVDGRSGVSDGVTTKELAQIMQSAGAYTAVNMDGGGSSCMYIDSYGPVNVPSDGSERAVANCVFLVSTAPSDPVIGQIIPYKANLTLPRYGEYTPQFYGYNQYGALLDLDVQHVSLSCDPSLGIIEGNKFIASGGEPGYITASYNNTVTATIHVDFIPVSDVKIRLDTVIVDSRSDYPVEVMATSGGNTFPITGTALSWEVGDPEICEMVNGNVKALQNGTTWIRGTIDGMKDTLVVSVENPATNRVPMMPFRFEDWTLEASSHLNATLNTENLPELWQEKGIAMNFKFAAGRAPYIRISNTELHTYGLPDTIKIILNTGGVSINSARVYLKPNNTTATVSKNITAFPTGADIELAFPLDEIINTSDRANFPLKLDNINFQLETSMTAGQNYTLALKEIVQIYKGISGTGIRHPKTTRFSVYPNPSTGQEVYISLEEGQDQALQIEIYTFSGRKVQTEILNIEGGMANFTRKNLSAGIYLMKVRCNELSETIKLIIQ